MLIEAWGYREGMGTLRLFLLILTYVCIGTTEVGSKGDVARFEHWKPRERAL